MCVGMVFWGTQSAPDIARDDRNEDPDDHDF